MRFPPPDDDPVPGEAIDGVLLYGPAEERGQLTAEELYRALAFLVAESRKAYTGGPL